MKRQKEASRRTFSPEEHLQRQFIYFGEMNHMPVCSSHKSSSQFYWIVSAAVSVSCSIPSFRQFLIRVLMHHLIFFKYIFTSAHVCLFIFWLRWLENSLSYCLNIPPAIKDILEAERNVHVFVGFLLKEIHLPATCMFISVWLAVVW